MRHNGSKDTSLHQTDAQGLQSRRTRRTRSLGRQPLIVGSSKLGMDHGQFTTRNEYKQAQANIYFYKNITPYKIKYYKSEQYKIESASTVTRGKEPR
jgi:hypothetical protein